MEVEKLSAILRHPVMLSVMLQTVSRATGMSVSELETELEQAQLKSTPSVLGQLRRLVQALKDNDFSEDMIDKLLNHVDLETGVMYGSSPAVQVAAAFNPFIQTFQPQQVQPHLMQSASALLHDSSDQWNAMDDDAVHEFVMKEATVLQVAEAELNVVDMMFERWQQDMALELKLPPPPIPLSSTSGTPSSSTAGVKAEDVAQSNLFAKSDQQAENGELLQGGIDILDPEEAANKRPEDVIDELKKKYSDEMLTEHFAKKQKKNFDRDATEYLNSWFFANLSDPYPNDEQKKQIAQDTGLTISQISNWFGNKRMRYKRKKLEEFRSKDGDTAGAETETDMSMGETGELHEENEQDPAQ